MKDSPTKDFLMLKSVKE